LRLVSGEGKCENVHCRVEVGSYGHSGS
jgi:hypothetical protein